MDYENMSLDELKDYAKSIGYHKALPIFLENVLKVLFHQILGIGQSFDLIER